MTDRHGLLDTILGAFVPIHPDGYKFVGGAALATLILFALAPPLGWLAAIVWESRSSSILCSGFYGSDVVREKAVVLLVVVVVTCIVVVGLVVVLIFATITPSDVLISEAVERFVRQRGTTTKTNRSVYF